MGIAVPAEDDGVTFTSKESTKNGQAGGASDVADDVVKLEVHLVKCFLHVLDMCGAVAQEHIPLAGDGAEAADLFSRTERGGEQSVAVQLLEPLAIEDISLFAGDVFDIPGIDQADLDAEMLEDVV